MREIDNKNINSVNFKGIQKAQNEVPQEAQPIQQPQDTKEMDIKDLGKIPAASLGQSQIATDSIENDLKFLEKNPQLAKELMVAIDKYAENHTQEETLAMLEKTHQEFISK